MTGSITLCCRASTTSRRAQPWLSSAARRSEFAALSRYRVVREEFLRLCLDSSFDLEQAIKIASFLAIGSRFLANLFSTQNLRRGSLRGSIVDLIPVCSRFDSLSFTELTMSRGHSVQVGNSSRTTIERCLEFTHKSVLANRESHHINGDAQQWCARSPSGCYIDTRRRSAFGRTNDDPNMLTEYRERLHQALKRDATELIVSDRRDLRLRHA